VGEAGVADEPQILPRTDVLLRMTKLRELPTAQWEMNSSEPP